MGKISIYPHKQSIDLSMKEVLTTRLKRSTNGISELTFVNLYLFRSKYDYHVSETEDGKLIILSEIEKTVLFPEGLPLPAILRTILSDYPIIRTLSEAMLSQGRTEIETLGGIIVGDRDHYDYVYRCKDLAELKGRHYHKKRNLVNNFLRNFHAEHFLLDASRKKDAYAILERWRSQMGDETDYAQSYEALARMEELDIRGHIVYANGGPVAFALGEFIEEQFVVHYEKACIDYVGSYQYLNMSLAAVLCGCCAFINLEQDMGFPGLRQSKLTYRPAFFIRKYRILFSHYADRQMIGRSADDSMK